MHCNAATSERVLSVARQVMQQRGWGDTLSDLSDRIDDVSEAVAKTVSGDPVAIRGVLDNWLAYHAADSAWADDDFEDEDADADADHRHEVDAARENDNDEDDGDEDDDEDDEDDEDEDEDNHEDGTDYGDQEEDALFRIERSVSALSSAVSSGFLVHTSLLCIATLGIAASAWMVWGELRSQQRASRDAMIAHFQAMLRTLGYTTPLEEK